MSDLSEEQYDLLNRLVAALVADERIEAIWLEGSIARGNADRYSDVDLHAYVPYDREGSSLSQLFTDLPGILSPVGPITYLRTIPGSAVTTGVMADGGRFDIVLETEEDLKRPRHDVKVLSDPKGEIWTRLRFAEEPSTDPPERIAFTLGEFWRCLGLLPTVLARGELIVMFQGHAAMMGYAVEVAMAAEGRVRITGAKRLNPSLNPSDRHLLEESLPSEPTLHALASAMLRLSKFVSRRGRECAEFNGIPYPEELERAMMDYVLRELARFGLSHLVPCGS